jgi:hypothetical protein
MYVSTQTPSQKAPKHKQLPLWQISPEGHTVPQVPQLPLSVVVSTQLPLQQVFPALHLLPQVPQLLLSVLVSTQVPLQQAPEQALPQVPQLVGVVRSVQVPLQQPWFAPH